MIHKFLLVFLFKSLTASLLSFIFFPITAAKSRDLGFNVFCVSNKDGTGICSDLVSGHSLNCIIIPGQVINCKNSLGNSLQCVLISQYTQNQSEFFCNEQVNSAPSPNFNPPSTDRVLGVDMLPNVLFNVF